MELGIDPEDKGLVTSYLKVLDRLDEAYSRWYLANVQQIATRNRFARPNVIDQVVEHIRLRHKGRPVCLLVLDCLSFTTWRMLKEGAAFSRHISEEHLILSSLPTLTKFCRRSLVSGTHVRDMPENINTPEEELWMNYWDGSMPPDRIMFIPDSGTDAVMALDEPPTEHRLCVIVNTLDDLAHSSVDMKDHRARVDAFSNGLDKLVMHILEIGYDVIITTDHGSRLCDSHEYVKQDLFTDTRGGRYVISSRERDVKGIHLMGDDIGLFRGKHIYLSNSSTTFSNKDVTMDHGGLTLQETLVPFIKLSKGGMG